ncbi:MAG: hypothetical protein LBH56_03620, partial [Coriobacteriales bacterium]|nr:hypothetical protein [Coriobacteriales bacterium]
AEFSAEELSEARRALLSLRNKNEKASNKLKEGSWQSRLTIGIVRATDVALGLIDGNNGALDVDSLSETHAVLTDARQRAEAVIGKFAEGTSQRTLQKNRIAALNVALTLVEREQTRAGIFKG